MILIKQTVKQPRKYCRAGYISKTVSFYYLLFIAYNVLINYVRNLLAITKIKCLIVEHVLNIYDYSF